MQVERKLYLDRLIARKHNGFVKIITGIRRCGKSYLLFKLFRDHLIESGIPAKRIIQISLDDDGNRELRDPIRLGDWIRRQIKGRVCIASRGKCEKSFSEAFVEHKCG